MLSKEYNEAVHQYTTALDINPPSSSGLYVKRSKARAEIRLWEDALMDAEEVS